MTRFVDYLPRRVQDGSVSEQVSFRSVALVVQDGVESFGLGVMCEVWGEPYHPEEDNPTFDLSVVTARPGRVRGSSGFDLLVEHGLDKAYDADLVCVIPHRDYRHPDEQVLELVRRTDARGGLLFAHCTAAWTLGAAGVLDGRRYTTHWRHADAHAEAFPVATLERDVLYVQDDHVLTGAGTAAGLDAALHLMREAFGAKVAADAARRMVVPPYREGGQAQFISRPVPECDSDALSGLLAWISENLAEELTVDGLARRVSLSPRTFARRFKEETGTSPYGWVLARRVAAAEELLERTDVGVDQIADLVGFGSGAALRHHFVRARGISPSSYRRAFSC